MGASLQDSKFVDKFTEFAAKLGSQIHLSSLRDAFATVMPLYILAGLAVLFNNTIFSWILSGSALTSAQYWGNLLVNATLNISSLLVATVIGYCLSRNRGYDNPIAAALVSLATLIIMMPGSVSVVPEGATEGVMVSGVLTFNNIGTQAMFGGVIIGLISTELFVYIAKIKKFQINMGESIPPAVGKSFSVLIPFILVMSFFAIISAILNNVFHTDLITLITVIIQEPLRGVGYRCVWMYSYLFPWQLSMAVWYPPDSTQRLPFGPASAYQYDTKHGSLCCRCPCIWHDGRFWLHSGSNYCHIAFREE